MDTWKTTNEYLQYMQNGSSSSEPQDFKVVSSHMLSLDFWIMTENHTMSRQVCLQTHADTYPL